MEAVIETFKPVKGYEGLYEVSDYGCVRSLNYNHTGTCKELKNKKNCYGYEQIGLCRGGKPKYFSIHRLVWEAFNGPIPEGLQIDHINTIRDDNRLANLRVVTSKENNANPISVENHREGVKRRSQDVKWREVQREAGKRRSQDPQWREVHREGTRKACNKPILQLDKVTGEVIREWECTADVERELYINHRSISECCNNKRKSAGGFRWCFVSD